MRSANALGGFLFSHIPKIGEILNEKKIIAVFDNDTEGNNQFDLIAKKYDSFYKTIIIDGITILKHIKYNVYIIKLLAPEFRVRWINQDKRYCYLSVELLLMDNNIGEEHRDYIPDTYPPKFCFKAGNKVNFANHISDDADFSGFRETIDLIRKIKDK